jgi:hypothetical protein
VNTRAAALVAVVIASLWGSPSSAQDEAAPPEPCSSPHARDFDFWLGQWEVTANDEVVGFSTISSILDGCVIFEEYSGANGSYSGKSFNYYDDSDGKWHQDWVDTGGLRLHLSGGFADGKMTMTGRRTKAGKTIVDRIEWSFDADGNVRQVWESSQDDGKTWSTSFDGLYTKM